MAEIDPWLTTERIDDPPSLVAYWRRRGRLVGIAIGFAFPIGALLLLLGGVSLLDGPPVRTVLLWLATVLGVLVTLLAGVEVWLGYRLARWARGEVGAYDYAWIERARKEQPVVGEMARECLVNQGAVPVAELVRIWRVYTREQRKTYGERRRQARRRCAQQLGLRPKQASTEETTPKVGGNTPEQGRASAVAGARESS